MKLQSSVIVWLAAVLVLHRVTAQDIKPYNYRMSFGSCFRHQIHKKDSGILDRIRDDKPDSYVWLGDFAYLDIIKLFPITKFFYNTPEVIKEKFEDSYNDPHYERLRKSTKIYGIWDDHDSGINNSDKDNERKEEIRQLFLDYMDEPKDSLRRTRKGGMYESYYLDPAKNVKLILLDGRYQRDSLKNDSVPFEQRSILGKEQEAWLKKEVEESNSVFTVLGFGNQILPDDRPIIEHVFESTRRFLLSLHNPKTNILFVSGDVHMAEIMIDTCSHHVHGYNITEFTSSGLTHSVYDVLAGLSDAGMDFLFPETYNKAADRYMSENYGLIDFHIDPLNPENSSIEVNIKDYWGNTRLYKKLIVMHDFPKREIPDLQAYSKCTSQRSPVRKRLLANFFSKSEQFAKSLAHKTFV